MSSQTRMAGFVPVDSVFSENGASYVQYSAGDRLREARAKAGLTLDSASARTRIRRDYLEALETMDTRGLPARAYALGYLRTYAGFLGIEPVGIVDQFKREVDTETGRAVPSAGAKTRDPIKLPRGVFGALLILVSVASVAWWYSEQAPSFGAIANLPSPPDAAPEWARADFQPELRAADIGSIWTGVPLGDAAAGERLTLRATAPTSLEVQDASGRILYSRSLVVGDIYQTREDGLTFSASDAGAIQLERGGVDLGTLGLAGIPVENIAVASAEPAAGELE
ncbi:helix-turn-helix domain-containing protein [uncultured Maricaulis sp.]|uniref:helix-turn-helix domain-containing protein n=1 Tax=uncultured Maricaulis sp. TaxID=174710 RepID=UPI0030DAE0C8